MSVIRWKSFAVIRETSLCAPASGELSAKAIAAAKSKRSAASSTLTVWFPLPCVNAVPTLTAVRPALPPTARQMIAVSVSSRRRR